MNQMERILSGSTIELIKVHWAETGLQFPIGAEESTNASLTLLEFFTDLESFLSMDEAEGKDVDEILLSNVSKAVDELNIDSEQFIDFEKLQKQIMT